MVLMSKKVILKKLVKGYKKDGIGGPGKASSEDASLAPYKNSFYKHVRTAAAFSRIAKLTGYNAGLQGKYPKSKQEALDQMSGN